MRIKGPTHEDWIGSYDSAEAALTTLQKELDSDPSIFLTPTQPQHSLTVAEWTVCLVPEFSWSSPPQNVLRPRADVLIRRPQTITALRTDQQVLFQRCTPRLPGASA